MKAFIDDSFDEGLQLMQSKSTKVWTEVPFINSTFKPSADDWKKVQTGLLLLRGHAEGASDKETAPNVDELKSMLAVLKELHGNANHSMLGLDATEEDSNEWFEVQKAKHEKKLEEIRERDEKHIEEHDFYVVQNKSENMLFTYWGGVRERQHKKYVDFHKVQEGMMGRVKVMIDGYEGLLAGKSTDSFDQKAPSQSPAAIIDFCDAALVHVSDALKRSEF